MSRATAVAGTQSKARERGWQAPASAESSAGIAAVRPAMDDTDRHSSKHPPTNRGIQK